MAHNKTDQTANALSHAQLSVLTALLTGSTVTDAASAGGVARTSVHRWLRRDWEFQAELNRLRREIRDATEMRLLSTAESAARTVATAVEGGDTTTALAVLRGLGLLSARNTVDVLSDDPVVLEEERRIGNTEASADRGIRSLIATFRNSNARWK